MDIVRSTFEKDGYKEFVDMVDNNDTRVIALFAKYGIAFPDEVDNLLDLEMGLKFGEDVKKIINQYPDFENLSAKMIKDLSSKDTEYDPSYMLNMLDCSDRDNCPVRDELYRCSIYYNSFYLDVPDFDPYAEKKDNN